MKTSFVFVAAAALFAQSAVALEKCVYATVAPNLHGLARPITSCLSATDNKFDLMRSTVPATSEQSVEICTKCKDFVDAVNALPPWPECTLDVGGKNQTLTAYFDAILGECRVGGAKLAATGSGSDGSATTNSVPSSAGTPVPSPSSAAMSTGVGAFAATVTLVAASMALGA